MAQPGASDPLQSFVADGRLFVRPITHYGVPEIITINLEIMANAITHKLNGILLGHNRLRNEYLGSGASVTNTLTGDISALVDFLIGSVYNRLRTILETKAPNVRVTRMNTRCPIPNNMEFPTWLSSAVSSIGPLRIMDGPVDTLIVFATSSATMNNYGRDNQVNFTEGYYNRLTTAFKAIGLPLAPLSPPSATGSFFPTLYPHISEDVWSVYGVFHHSHYEHEDLSRLALVTSQIGVTPFEDMGMTIGYVDDNTTLTALAAVAAPEDIPAGSTATSAGRPVGAHFRVNHFGIQPAVAASGTTPAKARGIYIVGRGVQRHYQFVLAHSISTTEIFELLRFKILGKLY